jgi:hypothetical protein
VPTGPREARPDDRLRTSPESILPAGVMDSGPAPRGASRNDEFGRAQNGIRNEVICMSSPAPFAKILRFPFDANHFTFPRCLVPLEGRLAIVTDAGRDAMDAGDVKRRMTLRADGEVVWSCSPVLFSLVANRIKRLNTKYLGDVR